MNHHFDMTNEVTALDLFAEELPQQTQLLSDCASTILCVVCGASSIGSIISSGATKAV